MNTATRRGLSRRELEAIASGHTHCAIDDMEFFETLAHAGCFFMSPWVYHYNEQNELEPLTPILYQDDYSLDKAGMLLAVMDRLLHPHAEEALTP